MTRLLVVVELAVLHLYKVLVSPLLGPRCRFTPTCSEYARQAISVHGLLRGNARTIGRVLRCHPLGGEGLDPP